MAKKVLVYGTDFLGIKYGFKVLPSAYPDDLLTGLGFTKLAANSALPSDVSLIKRNRASDRFQRVSILTEGGKSCNRFVATTTAAKLKALKGVTLLGSKITEVSP